MPDDRKLVDGEWTDDAGSRHGAPADAGERQRTAMARSQRTRQCGAQRIAGFFGGDDINRKRARLQLGRSSRRVLAHAGDENLRPIGSRNDLGRLGDDGAAGSNSEAGKPGARRVLDGLRPDRGQIEAAILAGFWRLDQNADAGRRGDAPLPAQIGNPRQHIVGAFRRLDRKHVVVGDDRGLAHVERPKRRDQFERARDVGCDRARDG